jgi:hypothetical protein
MEKTVKELALPSAAYMVGILVTVWFLVLQQITFPLSFLGMDFQVNLSFLGLPLTCLLLFRFISLLIEKLVVGDIVLTISEGLKTLSLTGFIFLLSDWSLVPSWVKPIAGFFLFSSLFSVLHKVIVQILSDINQLFEPIITSIYILLVGYLGSNTWLQLYPILMSTLNNGLRGSLRSILESGLAEPINNIIIISTALTSILALTGLGADHPNSYLRFMSKTVGENLSRVTLINFSLLYYLFFVRNFLFLYSGVNPQFLTVGEWLLVCACFYVGYHNLKDYAETSLILEDVTGAWRKHLQQVETVSDPQLELLSRFVESFVDYGLKDDLVTHLAILLNESGLSMSQISQINGLLIGYQDTKAPRVGFPWQILNHKKYNLQRRKQVINTVLSSIKVK